MVSGAGELASVGPVIGEEIDDILARTLMKSAPRSQFASSRIDASSTITRYIRSKLDFAINVCRNVESS